MATKRSFEQDPEYDDDVPAEVQENRLKVAESDVRHQTEKRIETILQTEFQTELSSKDNEIEKINDLLHESRNVLDRLRALIVTKFYANAQRVEPSTSSYIHPAVKQVLDESSPGSSSSSAEVSRSSDRSSVETLGPPESILKDSPVVDENSQDESIVQHAPRVRVKFQVVIGNVSKFIPVSQRSNDDLTHTWKVYVREGSGYPDIATIVKKVRFFLHPSFRPNDILDITSPPFEIVKRGWGDFPLRAEIHFKDSINKPVHIIHHVKLDKTYTGLTTLGDETHADIQLLRVKELFEHQQQNQQQQQSAIKVPEPLKSPSIVNSIGSISNSHNKNTKKIIKPPPSPIVSKVCTSPLKKLSIVTNMAQPAEIVTSTSPKTAEQKNINISSNALNAFLNGTTPFLVKCTDKHGVPKTLQLKPTGNVEVSKVSPGIRTVDAMQNKGVAQNKPPLYVLKIASSQSNKPSQVLLLSKPDEMKLGISEAAISPKSILNAHGSPLNGVCTSGESILRSSYFHWQQMVTHIDVTACSDFESILKKVIHLFPLINEYKDRFPFSSPSLDSYQSWNIGKRRASEWQRASMLRRAILFLIQKKQNISIKCSDVWSRKQIMMFCRRHGYTPVFSESRGTSNSILSQSCLDASHCDTLSDAQELLKMVTDSLIVENNAEEEEIDVDIFEEDDDAININGNTSKSIMEVNTLSNHHHLNNHNYTLNSQKVLCKPHSSLAAVFVKETTSEISIGLKPVEIERGVATPVLEDMILAACKSFAEGILRNSINQSYKRTGGRIISPFMRQKMTSFTLWVIRHGQTLYNKQNIVQGQLDTPLSIVGFEQAVMVGHCLQNEKFTHVFSSDLQRASLTAEKIVKNNKFFKGTITTDERLRERKFGDCEGKSSKELKETAAMSDKILTEFCPPGAETIKEVHERAVDFFNYLCELLQQKDSSNANECDRFVHMLSSKRNCDKYSDSSMASRGSPSTTTALRSYNVLVVAHGGLIKELFRFFFAELCCKLPEKETIRIPQNASISKFLINVDEGGRKNVVCLQIHNRDHLKTSQTDMQTNRSDLDIAL